MPRYQFTPAAARAFAAAAAWTSGDDFADLEPPELLLGLLDEAESRAAEMLARRGVTLEHVRQRWPGLRPIASQCGERAGHFSPAVGDMLAGAEVLLADFPRPLVLATEHVLLGLVAARHELSQWLVERGLNADDLAGEIYRLYGYRPAESVAGVAVEPATGRGGDEATRRHGDTATDPVAGAECNDAPATECEGAKRRGGERATGRQGEGQIEAATWRVLDAAANRAREGLRVAEDYARFVLNDRHLMSCLKELRHRLAAALRRLPADELLAARDTLADVGTTVSSDAESCRPDLASVVTANAKRLQEALRSLEEFGKMVDPAMAAEVEQLRYQTYTLERALANTAASVRRLNAARLYVLVDGRENLTAFEKLIRALLCSGVDMIQLRDKRLADGELLGRARRLRELTRGTSTLFIMNDRADLARLAQADGVHVGQEELTVGQARAIVGAEALIGVSTHSLDQARQAVLDGANYIGVGPVFASQTKLFAHDALRGVDLLRAVQAEVTLPAFAIGGIDRGNLPQVLAAGFTRVAVSAAVTGAADPCQAVRELKSLLKKS
ncbi:MAG TPA: thiamine phosphate synthase [Pirellulales bacterium]|nr:thiamine phosphate synthase [Pirellulales bacterium]